MPSHNLNKIDCKSHSSRVQVSWRFRMADFVFQRYNLWSDATDE
jgi:hypothetical protein